MSVITALVLILAVLELIVFMVLVRAMRLYHDMVVQALIVQWSTNHQEHCGKDIEIPYPHTGACYWPLPKELTETEIARILDALPK